MKQVLPHVTISFAIAIIIFMILDAFNPLMNFEFNLYSQNLINIFCIISLVNGIYTLVILRTKRK